MTAQTARGTTPFRYIDTAVGDASYRNNIKTVEGFDPNGYADCYRSMLQFPEAFRAYVEYNNGSVEGYEGAALATCFAADFDSEDNLERSQDDARRTVRRWEAVYGLSPEALRYYFSGNKGFHVEIPAELFGGLEPSKDTAARLKAMGRLMLGESGTADLDIYNTSRLWRLPNTKNKKSGLYKIPLTAGEFFNLDIATIKKLAANKRAGVVFPDPSEFGVVDELRRLW
jgi:hypothetical protein